MTTQTADMMEAIQEIGAALLDPYWRITSGALYKIMTKDDADQPGAVVPFKPNAAQTRLIADLWYRNILLKARQVGGTTLSSVLWLDHALWNANQRCGIVAHDRESAEAIFRDKAKFAYDRLPEVLRSMFPLARDSASELLFAHNNSSFRVATSMRSGTIHRLHISELGKLARDFPLRAKEVIEGSIPAVPQNGIVIVESTAEGMSGPFYEMSIRAEAVAQEMRQLSPKEYRFHFVAWHDEPKYRTDPALVAVSPTENAYFDLVETQSSVKLDARQRAWYVATRDGEFSGSEETMWRQYPSTPAECWQQSTEGVYYARQLARARMEGRIGVVPVTTGVPVNSFWDIGSNDGTGIWLHQHIGGQNRFLRYLEGWFLSFDHYVAEMDDWANKHGPIGWGRHFLPHDADALKQLGSSVVSPRAMLEQIKPGWTFEVVPRVRDLGTGIKQTRAAFSTYWFDAEGCKEGLAHLASYRQRWNAAVGGWADEPVKDMHTEAADSLRQHAQGWSNPTVAAGARPNRSRIKRKIG